jgi:hypothetical protein
MDGSVGRRRVSECRGRRRSDGDRSGEDGRISRHVVDGNRPRVGFGLLGGLVRRVGGLFVAVGWCVVFVWREMQIERECMCV